MITNLTAAAALGLVLTGIAAAPARAAPPPDRAPKQVAEAVQIRPVAATETEEETTNCNTQRRRLWVESEGWIVRRVTICR